jgi:ABC-type antimicrobial peptide transport system permease subunit
MTTPHEPFAGFGTASGGGGPGRGRDPRPPGPPVSVREWARDLALGARFAVAGGRESWTRTLLTAVGVALGVAMLLLAAAVPAMMDARDDKQAARDISSGDYLAVPTGSSLLVAQAETTYHGKSVRGVLLRPDGPNAAIPPGIRELPAAGDMVVSPALKRLLDSSPLLRERLPYTVTGSIGQAGLLGPAELYYYAGSDRLVARNAMHENGNASRVAGFGHRAGYQVMGAIFSLLLVIVLVVLLLPVAVFIGTAVRLGGERRDRRLAALRLIGADIGSTRRTAAGEALVGALLGLLLGAVFFLLGRQLAATFTVWGISAFPADMTPGTGLTVLVVLAIPVASVAVTMVSLRGTVIEPLGVVRQDLGRPRRLWWRLLLPAAGLGLLAPLFGTVSGTGTVNEYQVATGAVLLLIGVAAILPWFVEAVVGRLRGGPVSWQLATRRLQLNNNASARMVSGVTVAVAGAIALQMLFAGVDDDFRLDTGADKARAQAAISVQAADGEQVRADIARIAATRGVRQVYGYAAAGATQPDASAKEGADGFAYLPVAVGDCPSLRQMAEITSCAPGSVFLVPPRAGTGDDEAMRTYLTAGARIDLNRPDGETYRGAPRLWAIPVGTPTVAARDDPTGNRSWGVFMTPQAVDGGLLESPRATIMVGLDPRQTDAIEYLRNAGARLGPDAYVMSIQDTVEPGSYTRLRRGLFAGATLTMVLIGASLLVTMLEQLRDRKKLLAVLVAFGTRRSVLAWSVLWQTTIPVVLGLLLACAGGLGLGAALLAMVDRPVQADWSSVATMSGIGAAVVFTVTLLSMPPLWRLMRADGLRTE